MNQRTLSVTPTRVAPARAVLSGTAALPVVSLRLSLLLPLGALALAALVLGGCGWSPYPGAPSATAPAAAPPAAAAAETSDAAANSAAAPGDAAAAPAAAGAGDAAPDAAAAEQAAAAPGDGAPPSSPNATPALALAAPSELLDSYRIAASYVITSLLPSGERRVESTQLQGAWRRTAGPFGFDASFTLTNVSGSRRQALGVVAVDDAVAIQSDGAWSTVAREGWLPYAQPDQLLSLPFISRVNQGEDLGRETVAGVDVTHYRLMDPQIFAAALQELAPPAPGGVAAVLLEGWVADAGYVVKYVLQAELSGAQMLDDSGNPVTGEQAVSAEYRLSDLDAVTRIEWPADAQPPNTVSVPGFVPNTFPLPEDARVTPRLGMVEIRTGQTEGDAAVFYRARLQELGWTFEGELGFYSAEKNGQRLRLTILPDEATGETVVRVFGAGD